MASPGLKTAALLGLLALLAACGEKKAPQEYLPRVFVQEVKPASPTAHREAETAKAHRG